MLGVPPMMGGFRALLVPPIIRLVELRCLEIFNDETDEIINEFYEIENKIRVATSYGKRHNGELLEKTQESFNKIESICLDKLK